MTAFLHNYFVRRQTLKHNTCTVRGSVHVHLPYMANPKVIPCDLFIECMSLLAQRKKCY